MNTGRFLSWCVPPVVLAIHGACSSPPLPDTIGEGCDASKGCGGGLSCYSGDTVTLDGLCTVTCTAVEFIDSCVSRDPNTFCFGGNDEAFVCARHCGEDPAGGEAYPPCPAGSSCNANDGACERQ